VEGRVAVGCVRQPAARRSWAAAGGLQAIACFAATRGFGRATSFPPSSQPSVRHRHERAVPPLRRHDVMIFSKISFVFFIFFSFLK